MWGSSGRWCSTSPVFGSATCAPWNETIGDVMSSSDVAAIADRNIRPVTSVTAAPASLADAIALRVLSDGGWSAVRMVPSMSSPISLKPIYPYAAATPGSGRIGLAMKLSPRMVLWMIVLPVVIYVLVLAYRGG